MKLTIQNFFQSITSGFLSAMAVSAVLIVPLNAGEHEIWYDAKGKPAILKDKITGKMRLPTAEELAAYEQVVGKANSSEKEEAASQALEGESRSSEIAKFAEIPMVLVPKVDQTRRFYTPYRSHCLPYYSNYSIYPYLSSPVVPQFSNNGYHRPMQYLHHGYPGGYHHRHHGYYSGYRGGFLLRYSRPGLTIRARF